MAELWRIKRRTLRANGFINDILAPELLIDIFRRAIETVGKPNYIGLLWPGDSVPRRTWALGPLRLVCTYWNELCVGTPMLWSSICLDDFNGTPKVPVAQLPRKLQISILETQLSNVPDAQLARVHSIHIYHPAGGGISGSADEDLKDCTNRAVPALEHLTIFSDRPARKHPSHHFTLFLNDCPRLRTLSLQTLEAHPRHTFKNLRCLYFSPPLCELQRVPRMVLPTLLVCLPALIYTLRACPALEDLVLARLPAVRESQLNRLQRMKKKQFPKLPHLRRLTVVSTPLDTKEWMINFFEWSKRNLAIHFHDVSYSGIPVARLVSCLPLLSPSLLQLEVRSPVLKQTAEDRWIGRTVPDRLLLKASDASSALSLELVIAKSCLPRGGSRDTTIWQFMSLANVQTLYLLDLDDLNLRNEFWPPRIFESMGSLKRLTIQGDVSSLAFLQDFVESKTSTESDAFHSLEELHIRVTQRSQGTTSNSPVTESVIALLYRLAMLRSRAARPLRKIVVEAPHFVPAMSQNLCEAFAQVQEYVDCAELREYGVLPRPDWPSICAGPMHKYWPTW